MTEPASPDPARPAEGAGSSSAPESSPAGTDTKRRLASRLKKLHDSGRNVVPEDEKPDHERPTSILPDVAEIPSTDEPPRGGITAAFEARIAGLSDGPEKPGKAAEPGTPFVVPPTLQYDRSKTAPHAPPAESAPASPFVFPPTMRYERAPGLEREAGATGLPVAEPLPPIAPPEAFVDEDVDVSKTPSDRLRAYVAEQVQRATRDLRPRPSRLRRWALWTLGALLAVRLLVGLALDFAVDAVLRETLGLTCKIERSRLRILSGEVVLEGVELAPLGGGERLAKLGRAELEVSWSELPAIVIHRLTIDDLDVKLHRERSGRIPGLADILAGDPPVSPSTATGAAKPAPSTRRRRVLLEATRIEHVRVSWQDDAVTPRVSTQVELDLRADNVANWPRDASQRLMLRLAAPGVLDTFRVDAGSIPLGNGGRAVDVALAIEGHPQALAPYLAPRAEVAARSFALELQGRYVTRPSSLDPATRTGDLTIDRASLRADDEELGFERLVASLSAIGATGVHVSSVVVEGPHASVARRADGAIVVGGLAWPEQPASEAAAPGNGAAALEVREVASAPGGAPERASVEARPVAVDVVALHGGRFAFHDLAARRPIDLEARGLEVAVRDLSWDALGTRHAARIEASVGVPGTVETIAVVGTAVPVGTERSLALDVDARGISPAGLAPYLARLGLEAACAHAQLGGHVVARARTVAPGTFALEGAVERVRLADDAGRELAAVDAAEVTSATLDLPARRLALGSVAITGPRLEVERQASGAVALLGLRTRAPEADPVARALEARRRAAPAPVTSRAVERVEVGRLAVTGAGVRWTDRALGEPLELALVDGTLALEDVAIDGRPGGAPVAPGTLVASARLAPGVGRVSLDALVALDPAAPVVSGTLVASELSAKALAPYLERAGITPALDHGRLEVRARAQGKLHGLALEDGRLEVVGARLAAAGVELAAIDRLELAGARVDAGARAIDLGAITVRGLRARASRDASGTLGALGLGFHERPDASGGPGPSSGPSTSGGGAASSEEGDDAPPPRIHWGEVDLRGGALAWRDDAVQPRVDLALSSIELTLGARHLDQEAHGALPDLADPAPFRLHAEAEGAVAVLEASGEVFPSLRAPVVNAHVRASGVTLEAVRPYLAAARLEPTLARGELSLQVEGSAALGRDEAHATLALRDVSVADGKEELLGLDRATVGLRLDRSAHTLEVTTAEVQRPRLRVDRLRSGKLALLGLALEPAGEGASPGPAPLPPAVPGEPSATPTRPLDLVVRSASVHGLAVHWRDALAQVALDLERGSFELGATRVGAAAAAGPFRLHAEVPDVGTLDLAGKTTLALGAPSLEATLAATHLRGAALAPYLAPRAELRLQDGSLRAKLRLDGEPHPDGGTRWSLGASDLELADARRPLFSWSELRASLPRWDPRGQVYSVEELSLDGVEGSAERLEDGRLSILGVALRAGGAPSSAPRPARAADAADAPADPLPQVTLSQAHVTVQRFTFVDRASAVGPQPPPPFVLTEAGLSLVQPFLLSLDDPTQATLDVEVHGKIDPVLASGVFFAHVLPFDSDPQATLSFELDGVNGPAILERLPSLAERWDLSSITAGEAKGAITAELKRSRRRLDQVLADPGASPIALELTTNGEARSTPDGPVLLGLDELRVDVAQLDLASGEARVRAVEVVNPKLRLRREEAGLRFLDAVRKEAPGATPASGPAPGADGVERPEVRVDRLTITDGDILLEDLTVQPAATAELLGLEIEVLGASSRTFRDPKPVRVRLGAKGGALFDELSGSGTLTFGPRLEGDLDLSLTGTRLPALSGYTRRAWRLGLVDGRLDAESRLRFRYGKLQSTTRVQLAQAQVDEPPEGSVLGKAIGISVGKSLALLRDEDDIVALDVPVRLELDENLRPVGKDVDVDVVAGALAAALKNGVTAPLGAMESIGRSIKEATVGKAEAHAAREVLFDTQDARLSAATRADLAQLASLLAGDDGLRATLRAEIGPGDEVRSRRLGSPSAEERRDLIARLEARRARLDRARADADAEVRAALLAGTPAEVGAARSHFARAERALLDIDRALDGLYDQEREGAERGSERRTREVEEGLCDARVEAVRAFLVAHGVPLERIRALRPRLKPGESTTSGRVRVEVGAREK